MTRHREPLRSTSLCVWQQIPAPPPPLSPENTLPPPFYPLPFSFFFRIARNYSNWSISIYRGSSQRVNGNSLVGRIGGEINFRFRLNFFLTFHLEFYHSDYVCVCVCCLCSQTLHKKLNSLLNHHDKIPVFLFIC